MKPTATPMLAKLRAHLTYANVMATIAVFVALSTGGAYAAHLVVDSSDVVDNSLTGADVQGKPGTSTTPAVNGSLTTDDIAGQQRNNGNGTPFIDGTLTQWDIKNGSLTGGDLANSTVTGAKIAEDTVGFADIAADAVERSELAFGAAGASEISSNAVGADELTTTVVARRSTSIPPSGGVSGVFVECPPGTQVISGGAWFKFPSGDITRSHMFANNWVAEGQNNGNVAQDLFVEAYCLEPGF